MTSDENTQM